MNKLIPGAIAAILLIAGGLSAPAEAAIVRGPAGGGGGGSSSNGSDCTVLCFAVPPRRPHVVNHQACTDRIRQLRPVSVAEVRRVDEHDVVHIVPLCDTLRRSLTQGVDVRLNSANIQGLLPAIAGNATLGASLEETGYRAHDVLGIALAPDAAILYVSHR
ncbi:MAG TPA: hypothetical protein VHB74_12605 [Devosia sp.]|nr:hypothetical protein [Devosia sp.]